MRQRNKILTLLIVVGLILVLFTSNDKSRITTKLIPISLEISINQTPPISVEKTRAKVSSYIDNDENHIENIFQSFLALPNIITADPEILTRYESMGIQLEEVMIQNEKIVIAKIFEKVFSNNNDVELGKIAFLFEVILTNCKDKAYLFDEFSKTLTSDGGDGELSLNKLVFLDIVGDNLSEGEMEGVSSHIKDLIHSDQIERRISRLISQSDNWPTAFE